LKMELKRVARTSTQQIKAQWTSLCELRSTDGTQPTAVPLNKRHACTAQWSPSKFSIQTTEMNGEQSFMNRKNQLTTAYALMTLQTTTTLTTIPSMKRELLPMPITITVVTTVIVKRRQKKCSFSNQETTTISR
jgi:hypothetical protein